jgi:hypothetical protein
MGLVPSLSSPGRLLTQELKGRAMCLAVEGFPRSAEDSPGPDEPEIL